MVDDYRKVFEALTFPDDEGKLWATLHCTVQSMMTSSTHYILKMDYGTIPMTHTQTTLHRTSQPGLMSIPIITWLNSQDTYELIHARMGHLGERVMSQLHLHANDIAPMRKLNLFIFKTRMAAKATKQAIFPTNLTPHSDNGTSKFHPKSASKHKKKPKSTQQTSYITGHIFPYGHGLCPGYYIANPG